MYVNELLAIARQNELLAQGEHARRVREVRGDRRGVLARCLGAARRQVRRFGNHRSGRAQTA